MNKTHLIKILKKLSLKERVEYKEYVYSPFFNKNEKVKTLCAYVLRYAPDFESSNFTKEAAYKKVFKKSEMNVTALNNVISDLLQLLFDFLSYKNYQQTGLFQRMCLMDELLNRDLEQSMLKISKRYRKEKDKIPFQHASTFFEEYLYYKKMDDHFLMKPSRNYDENLQLKNDQLDLFYLATKLKIACDMTSRNIVINANYDCHFLEGLLIQIEEEVTTYRAYPAITVYYEVLKMLKTGDATHYRQLKALLEMNLAIFPNDELRVLYDYARNYCIQQINTGDSAYYKEILELYQFLLEQKIIFKNGYLTQWDYKNIVTVGTRLEVYDWTEQFIHNYKNYLPQKEQENAFIYNLASYHYAKQEYKKSLMLLHEVKFIDTSYHLGAKIIQLKSYYELEEHDAFYALIEAFKIYLLRNRQISSYRKKANLNLIKLAQKILQLEEKKGLIHEKAFLEKKEKLHQRLENTSPLASAAWLRVIFERL